MCSGPVPQQPLINPTPSATLCAATLARHMILVNGLPVYNRLLVMSNPLTKSRYTL